MYSMIIVSDQDLKQRLSETCDDQPFIAKAPLVIVFLADLQRWYDYYHDLGVADFCIEREREFSGPDEAGLLLASCDALIAAQNAVISAEALGIGSCYIGDIMENYEIHKELLNLPPYVFPITMLCFGYYPEGERPKPRDRFDSKYIVSENKYQRLTEKDRKAMFAARAEGFNPNGTDSTERGRSMWARVKGRTENDLLRLPFKRAYMFRPGYIHPTKGLKRTNKYYRAISWLYPVVKHLIPNHTISMRELGIAMIHTVNKGYDKSILECKDIAKLANT